MVYEKARVKLLDKNTGQVLKEVDVLTSADAVFCSDGQNVQVILDNLNVAMLDKKSRIEVLESQEVNHESRIQVLEAENIEHESDINNINTKLGDHETRITNVETNTTKLSNDMANIKAGNNGIGYLKHSTTITGPVSQVDIGITFNKDLDVLFVFKNTTYIEVGLNYDFSSDGKYILPKNDTWTGSVDEPTVFNFLMFKATPMNQLEVDGGIISDGTLNFNKFDAYTKDLIMKIPAERITGGIFGGIVKAKMNTEYTTAQLRNVIMSTSAADATKMNNGDIWIVYQ